MYVWMLAYFHGYFHEEEKTTSWSVKSKNADQFLYLPLHLVFELFNLVLVCLCIASDKDKRIYIWYVITSKDNRKNKEHSKFNSIFNVPSFEEILERRYHSEFSIIGNKKWGQ